MTNLFIFAISFLSEHDGHFQLFLKDYDSLFIIDDAILEHLPSSVGQNIRKNMKSFEFATDKNQMVSLNRRNNQIKKLIEKKISKCST